MAKMSKNKQTANYTILKKVESGGKKSWIRTLQIGITAQIQWVLLWTIVNLPIKFHEIAS